MSVLSLTWPNPIVFNSGCIIESSGEPVFWLNPRPNKRESLSMGLSIICFLQFPIRFQQTANYEKRWLESLTLFFSPHLNPVLTSSLVSYSYHSQFILFIASWEAILCKSDPIKWQLETLKCSLIAYRGIISNYVWHTEEKCMLGETADLSSVSTPIHIRWSRQIICSTVNFLME